MTASFDFRLRTLECRQCGAPVDASLQGGAVTCGYCGSVNVVSVRAVAPRVGVQSTVADEIARLGRLKAQLEHPIRGHAYDMEQVPVGLAPKGPGTDASWGAAWQQVRRDHAERREALALEEQRRICWLALALADALRPRNPRQARAVLETALEILPDEGHRHLIRCQLAMEALEEGDLASAHGWLDECDPATEVLELDTAWRLARALLAVGEGDGARLLSVVGARAGDVPIHPSAAARCARLRIHAMEKVGDTARADQALESALAAPGGQDMLAALAAEGLAGETVQRYSAKVEAERVAAEVRQERALLNSLIQEQARLPRGFLTTVLSRQTALPVLALVMALPVAVSRCTLDADPLLGVWGLPVCPWVCDDCFGPARTVTVWRPMGAGKWTSDGAQYFCRTPTNGLGSMSDDALETAARSLDTERVSFVTAWGASLLLLQLLLLPWSLTSGVKAWSASVKKHGELAERIRQARLRAPPGADGEFPPQPVGMGRNPVAHALAVLGVAIVVPLAMVGLGLLL